MEQFLFFMIYWLLVCLGTIKIGYIDTMCISKSIVECLLIINNTLQFYETQLGYHTESNLQVRTFII